MSLFDEVIAPLRALATKYENEIQELRTECSMLQNARKNLITDRDTYMDKLQDTQNEVLRLKEQLMLRVPSPPGKDRYILDTRIFLSGQMFAVLWGQWICGNSGENKIDWNRRICYQLERVDDDLKWKLCPNEILDLISEKTRPAAAVMERLEAEVETERLRGLLKQAQRDIEGLRADHQVYQVNTGKHVAELHDLIEKKSRMYDALATALDTIICKLRDAGHKMGLSGETTPVKVIEQLMAKL